MRRKILIAIGLFLCSLLLSCYLVLRSQWLREKLRTWGTSTLEQMIDGTVEVRSVGGSLISNIVLEGVRITKRGKADPLLQFEKGEMGYNPLKLLGRRREIEYIRVDSPVLNLANKDGEWNFHNLFISEGGEGGSDQSDGGGSFRVKAISLSGGKLDLKGVPFFDGANEVDLHGSITSDERGLRMQIEKGKGGLPGGVVGKLLTGTVSIREGAVRFQNLHLLTDESSIFLDGIVSDSLILDISNSHLSLRELRQYFSLKEHMEGEIDGDVLLTGKAGGIRITGDVTAPQGNVANYRLRGLRSSIQFEKRVLRLGVKKVDVGGGKLRGEIVFDFDRSRFEAEGEGEGVDLCQLFPTLPGGLESSLQGSFSLQSHGLPWERPFFEGEIRLQESSLGGVGIDRVDARFEATPSSLKLTSLKARVAGGTFACQGSIDREMIDLSLESSDISLSQIGPSVGLPRFEGTLSSDLHLMGEPTHPSLYGAFWMGEGSTQGVVFDCLAGNLALRRIGREPLGRAELYLVNATVLNTKWKSGVLIFVGEEESFACGVEAEGEGTALEAEGTGIQQGDSLRLVIDRFLLTSGGEKIENRENVELCLRKGDLLIRRADFALPAGTSTISGKVSPSKNSSLTASGEGLSLRRLCLLLKLERDLRGELDFHFTMEGNFSDPRMTFTLHGDNVCYEEGSFDTLNLDLVYEDRMCHIKKCSVWRGGAESEVAGSLPMDLSLRDRGNLLCDGDILARAILSNMGVWVFFPFNKFVEVSSGRVDANLDIKGTWRRPSLTGELTLNSGRMLLRFLGTRLSGVTSHLILSEEKLIVDSFSGATEGGEVRVKGVLRLERFRPASLDFKVRTTGVRVTGIEDVSALVDSDLHIQGTLEEPLFQGQVKVSEALVTVPFRKRKVGAAGLRARFALDLAVLSERNIWLRNDNADLELGADLKVARREGKVFVSGTLDTKRGYLYPPHIDVPFRITKGEFEFTKSVELDPALDLQAETEMVHHIAREGGQPDSTETVHVMLDVTGTMREPNFKFYSDPTYPLDDIVTLLSTGTTRQELASLQALGRGGERLASHYFRLKVLRQLQRTIAIDYIDMQTELLAEEKKAQLTIGKYVSKDLYVSYSQDLFATSKNQFKAEYYLWKGGAIVGERDEEDNYNLGIQFKFKY